MTSKKKPRIRTNIFDYHLCEKCCQEIDIRVDKYKKRTDIQKGTTSYQHIECPPLKELYIPEPEEEP
ncbi:MAG: hypothetical protein WC791_03020 [Candidatus Paceibacterota bacterium]|jgi:hypothetical protein